MMLNVQGPYGFPYGLTRRSSRNLWTFGGKWTVVREYKGSSPLKGQVGSLLVMMISFWRGCVKNQHFVRGGSVHNASSMLSHVVPQDSCIATTPFIPNAWWSFAVSNVAKTWSAPFVGINSLSECRENPFCRHTGYRPPNLRLLRSLEMQRGSWSYEPNGFGSVTAVVGADLTAWRVFFFFTSKGVEWRS